MEGEGLSNTATAVIQITDANDNAPVFDPIKVCKVVQLHKLCFVCVCI